MSDKEKALWVVRVAFNKFKPEPEAIYFDLALSSEKGYETKYEAMMAFCQGEANFQKQWEEMPVEDLSKEAENE